MRLFFPCYSFPIHHICFINKFQVEPQKAERARKAAEERESMRREEVEIALLVVFLEIL